jgi:hypothetical protein
MSYYIRKSEFPPPLEIRPKTAKTAKTIINKPKVIETNINAIGRAINTPCNGGGKKMNMMIEMTVTTIVLLNNLILLVLIPVLMLSGIYSAPHPGQ